MAVIRSAGGPGGRGNFRLVWQGATVLRAWDAQIQAGLRTSARQILDDLHQEIHVDSGEMRDKAFAEVLVAGTKRTIVAGSAADHAIYEELGTRFRPGHPQIRKVIDRNAPLVTQNIAQARAG
jgi:hypothetical protein